MAKLAISADSHIVEPRDVFAGLPERFGDRAPRIVRDEGKGDFVEIPATGQRLNATIGGVGRLGIAGMSLDDPETHRIIAQGYDGLRPALKDPVERMKEMDADGVWGEVLFPSVFMRLFGTQDAEVLAAAFQNYNDWLWDFCNTVPNRLRGLAIAGDARPCRRPPGVAARHREGVHGRLHPVRRSKRHSLLRPGLRPNLGNGTGGRRKHQPAHLYRRPRRGYRPCGCGPHSGLLQRAQRRAVLAVGPHRGGCRPSLPGPQVCGGGVQHWLDRQLAGAHGPFGLPQPPVGAGVPGPEAE